MQITLAIDLFMLDCTIHEGMDAGKVIVVRVSFSTYYFEYEETHIFSSINHNNPFFLRLPYYLMSFF